MLAITNTLRQEVERASFEAAYRRNLRRSGLSSEEARKFSLSSKARTLSIAGRSNNISLEKPEPPSDLWEQMDKLTHARFTPGPNEFTASDFGKRYGLGVSAAAERIRKLVDAGLVECAGIGEKNAKFYRIKK